MVLRFGKKFLSLICAAKFLCLMVRCLLQVLFGKHRVLFFFQGFFLCLESFRFVVESRLMALQYTSFLFVSFRLSVRLVFTLFGNSFRFLKPKWSLFFLHLHVCLCLRLLCSALCMVFCFFSFQCNNGHSFQLLVLQQSELRRAELSGRESATPYMAKSMNSHIH